MPGSDDKIDKSKSNENSVVAFPHSRVSPTSQVLRYKRLGMGKMADTLGAAGEQQSGHWCSRCQGIWFGFLLEVACPNCGNRQG